MKPKPQTCLGFGGGVVTPPKLKPPPFLHFCSFFYICISVFVQFCDLSMFSE